MAVACSGAATVYILGFTTAQIAVSLEIWRLIKLHPRYQISRSLWYVIMSRGNVIPIETE